MSEDLGKVCCVCGKWYLKEAYAYGNRDMHTNSYCIDCSREYTRIYNHDGLDAARNWREDMRAKHGK